MFRKRTALLGVMGLCLSPVAAQAEDKSLLDLSLEQLMNTQVTSVAKKSQKLEDAAAAITVISQEDIRRSGMTSIPELLRLAPGLQVAQIDASTWAIGSRGFGGRWSSNLLVLVDGRSIYTPLFSGVYWDAVDMPLENIERIEVIRGPGGTLWGANAVDGVINIITRGAASTPGTTASVGAGNLERIASISHGGEIGDSGHYRVFAKSTQRLPFDRPAGGAAHDGMDLRTAGFRADWALAGGDTVMAQAGYYDGSADHLDRNVTLGPPYTTPLEFTTGLSGHNLQLRWTRALSATSEWTAQIYWDHYRRRDVQVGESRDTYDLDFQHRFQAGRRNEITWGVNARLTADETDDKFLASFLPRKRTDRLISAFIQDEISLVPEKLRLTVGSKFEHNDYSGTEFQPSARLLWRIDPRQSAWAAVSRAVRTPSRADSDIRINTAAFACGPFCTGLVSIFGSPNFDSEKLLAYEAGYRAQVTKALFFDASVYLNEYSELRSAEPFTAYLEAVPAPLHLTTGSLYFNRASARNRGLELSANWQPTEKWTVKGSYSRLSMTVRRDADSADTQVENKPLFAPREQWQAHAFYQASAKLSLGGSLYHVSGLPGGGIPTYNRFDANLGWQASRNVEARLALRNLFDPGHLEYSAQDGPTASQIPRSVYGTVMVRF